MADILASDATTELAKETTKNGKKNIKSSLANFLVDFNVIQYTIAFIIALSVQEFLKQFMNILVSKTIPYHNEYWKLFSSFLVAVVIFVLAYIFVKFIFYKYIFTEDVEKERTIKKAITEKKQEAAMKELEKDKDTTKVIQESVDITEDFLNYNTYRDLWINAH